MTFRVNANSFKNAMGTMFLLAAAFFVCSTLISMRSVFADPIAPANTLPQRAGRISPRTTATNTANRSTVSRATTTRATNANTATKNRTTVSRGTGTTRTVSSRGVSPTRTTTASSRGVASRVKSNTNRSTNNRAVRARTASTPSRVSATGSVMSGSRASTSTSYSYLSSKLYTGSYSNIIDSSTGLISADAYSNCLESYYTCMDEICTARSDTKGRCSCAGRATNFLTAEEQLEAANEELIKLSGQLSLLIATKGKGDDLSYAFSLTEAEQVMNCVSWKEAKDKEEWYKDHPTYKTKNSNDLVTEYNNAPWYCTDNSYGFDIGTIDGSGSDILAQLKAWADAKDNAKEYAQSDNNNLISKYMVVSNITNSITNITSTDTESAKLDSLANRWGYQLFQYAHNNVCGRVLDSCFNGIYEACGTPPTITEKYTDSNGAEKTASTRTKCANGATSSCPFNYNSAISIDSNGDVTLNERGSGNTNSTTSASCFGYTTTSTVTGTRTTSSSSDPYATLRGPVADARRSIMQKYLLDANAACDVYGAALKQTAQNINYQKIAAEQALQQKRLEFKQEADAQTLADATAAIDNFNECISEIWDCYEEYQDEDKWTTARIKAYCSQSSQVPHCYETMICSPLQTQLVAVVDVPDSSSCEIYADGEYVSAGAKACRNVVTISEILYGTGADNVTGVENTLTTWTGSSDLTHLSSSAIREVCLQNALRTDGDNGYCNKSNTDCLRGWVKPSKTDETNE